MIELWYGIVALLLTTYVVLDGYDFGAGVLHLIVAKTDAERRQVLAAIGPYWDGNEVWLLASGGALLVGFPKALAAGLSGYYLAIFLLLWTLIVRGISIELRSHVEAPLWRAFWDAAFCGASALLAILFGAALGNILRGVSIGPDGWFSLPLFTDFSGRPPVGILDWYTVLVAVFSLLALTAHGAAFLHWKTDGSVHARARNAGRVLFLVVAVLWPLVTYATHAVHPEFFSGFASRPLAWVAAGVAIAGLVIACRSILRGRELAAFLGSAAFLAGLLGATAAGLFPVLLRSVGDPRASLTAYAAANDAMGLKTALSWLAIGLPLAVLYFVVVFRIHRGKVAGATGREGY
ncbi:MAG TPA: cytochrome d ubiquinol oxidase subunit II [Candidatus Polarisedimenticolaceae bacterium]|nr:cytochrome d ubiquinol oxidase subunit II [Candidatus Polarisedimenticolaceae bacterium]